MLCTIVVDTEWLLFYAFADPVLTGQQWVLPVYARCISPCFPGYVTPRPITLVAELRSRPSLCAPGSSSSSGWYLLPHFLSLLSSENHPTWYQKSHFIPISDHEPCSTHLSRCPIIDLTFFPESFKVLHDSSHISSHISWQPCFLSYIPFALGDYLVSGVLYSQKLLFLHLTTSWGSGCFPVLFYTSCKFISLWFLNSIKMFQLTVLWPNNDRSNCSSQHSLALLRHTAPHSLLQKHGLQCWSIDLGHGCVTRSVWWFSPHSHVLGNL